MKHGIHGFPRYIIFVRNRLLKGHTKTANQLREEIPCLTKKPSKPTTI